MALSLLTPTDIDNLKTNPVASTRKHLPILLGYSREMGSLIVQVNDKIEYVTYITDTVRKEIDQVEAK